MRACYFYRDNAQPKQNFQGSEQGYFHRWGTLGGDTVAILEDSVGNCIMTYVTSVRFQEPYADKK